MIQQVGRKIELDLTRKQRLLCAKSCGVARLAYNWELTQLNIAYDEAKKVCKEGEKPTCKLGSAIDWHRAWCAHKKDIPFVYEVSKCCGQEALRDLGNAWTRFFKKLGKHPRKHKKGINDSFRVTGSVYIGYDFCQIPGIGKIKLKEKGYVKLPDGVEKVPLPMATISRQANRWFVSFAYKDDIIPTYEKVCSDVTDSEDDIVGIDLGIKDLAITSNGMVYNNPKAYTTYEKRLIRYQKRVSRRKKGSKNRKRAILRLAIQHRKVTNIRIDCAHKTSSDIVKKLTPKVIVLETLKPKNMVRNHNLAKSLHDSNFGRLTNFIEYKSKQNNIKVVHAPMFYPSSQICSACGQYRKTDLTLADREWTCPVCGEHHDRDVNAARNLRYYGLWLFNHIQPTVSSTESYACSRNECSDGSAESSAVRDLRLQFFQSEEQCKSMKQEINSSYLMARNG